MVRLRLRRSELLSTPVSVQLTRRVIWRAATAPHAVLLKGYGVVDVLSDIASGLNTNRKGLLKLFNYVVDKQVDAVIVTYRDRLTRFGFEYFFKQYGVRVEVVYGEEPRDAYQELVEDLIAIVTSFLGKLYGMRSRREKKLVEGFKKLLEEVEKGG